MAYVRLGNPIWSCQYLLHGRERLFARAGVYAALVVGLIIFFHKMAGPGQQIAATARTAPRNRLMGAGVDLDIAWLRGDQQGVSARLRYEDGGVAPHITDELVYRGYGLCVSGPRCRCCCRTLWAS